MRELEEKFKRVLEELELNEKFWFLLARRTLKQETRSPTREKS